MQPRRQRLDTASQQGGGATKRRHRPDYLILLFMGLLMLVGLITMYAIGPQRAQVLNSAYGTDYSDTYFFIKQSVSLGLALLAFTFFAFVPHKFLQSMASKVLFIGLGACLLLAVVGNLLNIESLVPETLGAYRWFSLGPLGSFQPAELLKFGVLLYLAGFLGMRAQQGLINDKDRTLVPLSILVAVIMFFVIVLQKDMGTGLAMLAIVMAMLVVSGLSWQIIGRVFAVLGIAALLLIVSAPHRMERMATFMSGDAIMQAEDDEAYHIRQAWIAMGSGGLFGLGIGNSVQATGYLPEAINDSVFAILGETFGFVGLVAIIGLFVALLTRILKVAEHLADIRLRLLAVGVFGWLGAHVVINMAAMTGVMPLTGITLPLLSFGGTSMMFIAAALGLVFQLSRYTSHSSLIKEAEHEDSRSRRGVGRTRYASRRRFS